MKKFGDRKDAYLVRNMDGTHKFMLRLKPLRSDADVYINKKIDVTELVKYVKEKKQTEEYKDLTFFHTFLMACAKTIYNRPLLNRFVINGNYYDRKDISMSFVAKVNFEDDSEEYLSVIRAENNDTLLSIKEKTVSRVKEVRNNSKNGTDGAVDFIGKLPKLLRNLVIGVIKFADKKDLLPFSLIENDIYHSSVILSNLGSIHCGAIYHNLTNFGTNSILITFGEIHKEKVLLDDGKEEIRDLCEIGANLDERIADGFYFAQSIHMFEQILKNPTLLEECVNEKVELFKEKK